MKLLQQLQQLVEAASNKIQDHDEWMDAVRKSYPNIADKLKFKGRVEDGKHLFFAEIPGEDRCYGVYDMDKEEGEVLGESVKEENPEFGFINSQQADAHYAISKNGRKLITSPAGWLDENALWTWPKREKLTTAEAEKILEKEGFPAPKAWIDFYTRTRHGGNFGWDIFRDSLRDLSDEISSELGDEYEFELEYSPRTWILVKK